MNVTVRDLIESHDAKGNPFVDKLGARLLPELLDAALCPDMPSGRRRELLDVVAALVIDTRRGAKCAVELVELLKTDGHAPPPAADSVEELAHLHDSLAAFISILYTSRDLACQERVAAVVPILVAKGGLDEGGGVGAVFESVEKGRFARLVQKARRDESREAFARDVRSFVRAFNDAKGHEATGVTMVTCSGRVRVGRSGVECAACAFNGADGVCLALPLSDDPNDEKPVTFAYDTCVRVAKLADNVLEMGVRAPPVGWEHSFYPLDVRDDRWIKIEFSPEDVPGVKRALAAAATSHPSVFKGDTRAALRSGPACSKDSGFAISDAGKSPLAALKRPLPTIKTRGLNDRRLGSIQATGKSRDSDLNPSKEPLPANLPKAVVKPALSSLAKTRFEPKASFEPFVLSPGPKPDLSEFDVSPGPSPTHRASLSQNPAKLPATQSKTPSMSPDLSPRAIMAAAEDAETEAQPECFSQPEGGGARDPARGDARGDASPDAAARARARARARAKVPRHARRHPDAHAGSRGSREARTVGRAERQSRGARARARAHRRHRGQGQAQGQTPGAGVQALAR